MGQSSGDVIRFNLTDQFVDRHIREGRAQKAAIRCGKTVYTYGDLAADINRAGNGLLRLGLQDEQRVLLLLPDCPEFARILIVHSTLFAEIAPTLDAQRFLRHVIVVGE